MVRFTLYSPLNNPIAIRAPCRNRTQKNPAPFKERERIPRSTSILTENRRSHGQTRRDRNLRASFHILLLRPERSIDTIDHCPGSPPPSIAKGFSPARPGDLTRRVTLSIDDVIQLRDSAGFSPASSGMGDPEKSVRIRSRNLCLKVVASGPYERALPNTGMVPLSCRCCQSCTRSAFTQRRRDISRASSLDRYFVGIAHVDSTASG